MNIEIVREFLDYSPDAGVFVWKQRDRAHFATQRAFVQWNQRYAGTQAGALKGDSGYVIISIFKKLIRAHHLAWAIETGTFWGGEIDHINGVRHDNRIANLRAVSKAENTKNKRLLSNNKSGHHGISIERSGRFRAKGGIGSKQSHLGYFRNLEDAVMARKQFEQANGFHANHGVTA